MSSLSFLGDNFVADLKITVQLNLRKRVRNDRSREDPALDTASVHAHHAFLCMSQVSRLVSKEGDRAPQSNMPYVSQQWRDSSEGLDRCNLRFGATRSAHRG